MARWAIRKLEQISISPLSKIIKAEDYQRMVEGKQMIAEIKQQAKALYRQEKDAAYRAAKAQARQLTGKQMLDMASASIEYLSQVEQRLTKIVVESVERIIGDWEETDAAVRMVKNALHQVRNESRVTLRVSPDQAPTMKRQIEAITAAYPNIEFVDVVADQAIDAGACRLETPLGSIDTSVNSQIETLKKALAENFTGPTG